MMYVIDSGKSWGHIMQNPNGKIEKHTSEMMELVPSLLLNNSVVITNQDTDLSYAWIIALSDSSSRYEVKGLSERELFSLPVAEILEPLKRSVIENQVAVEDEMLIPVYEQEINYHLHFLPVWDSAGKFTGLNTFFLNKGTPLTRFEESPPPRPDLTRLIKSVTLSSRTVEPEQNKIDHEREIEPYHKDKLFDLFMKYLPGSAYIKDREGRYIYMNEYFRRVYDMDPEDYLGKDDFGVWPPDIAAKNQDEDRRVMESSNVIEATNEKFINGKRIAHLSYKFPIFCDDEKERCFLGGLSVNITERKQMEKRLLANQHKLRALAFELSRVKEKERRQLAADLHDLVAQSLAISILRLDALLASFSNRELVEEIEKIDGLVNQALKNIRSFIRDLSPPVLSHLGFDAAIQWLSRDMEKNFGLSTLVESDSTEIQISNEYHSVLFQIVRELLMNIVKHAETNRAYIRIRTLKELLRIEISDEGKGFNAQEEAEIDSFGLFNIQAKLSELKGEMSIHSEPGAGTEIEITVPLLKEDER